MYYRALYHKIFFLLIILAGAVLSARAGSELLDVRVGAHKQFDRVVFELSGETMPTLKVIDPQKIEVRFSGVSVRSELVLPSLPTDVNIIKRIDAMREGNSDLVFTLTLLRDATPSELPLSGSPWRLAVDVAPRTAQAPLEEKKPDYIPGDLPIPTKLAGDDVSSYIADPAQTHAILAFFYLNRGDTVGAKEHAAAYEKLTGKALDLRPQPAANPVKTQPAQSTSWQNFWPKKLPKLGIPTGVILLIIFGGGLLAGLVLSKLLGGKRPPRLHLPPMAKPPRRKPKAHTESLEEQLEQDMDTLDEAVAQEPPRKAAPPPPPEAELVPEPVLDQEQEAKESLMDRRVRRVLELMHEGRSITVIAEELQMGQDEVKLILDLNQ